MSCHVCESDRETTEVAGEQVCDECAGMFGSGESDPCYFCGEPATSSVLGGEDACDDCAGLVWSHESPDTKRDRRAFAKRLMEADLDYGRFIDVHDGWKKPVGRHDRYGPTAEELSGNYGVYGGDGLVDIDVDDAGDGLPDKLEELADTLSVASPHAGPHEGHLYVKGPADIADRFEQKCGARNPKVEWGEIRVDNQFTVGPGSTLAACDKDDHDCSEDGEGEYALANDAPILEVDAETLLALVPERDAPEPAPDTGREDVSTSSSVSRAEYRDRLEKAVVDSDSESLQALWSGNYSGFDDRSSAETALAGNLAWWFDGDKGAVRDAMDGRNLPDAVDPPALKKWPRKGESYKRSVLRAVDKEDGGYGVTDWDTVRWNYDNGNFVDARMIAADLLREDHDWFSHEQSGDLFRYDPSTGTWKSDGENRLHEILADKLGKYASENEQNKVEYHLSATKVDEDEIGASLDEPLVACENGTLNLETGELLDHSPEHMLLESIPVRYDPGVEPEAFDAFLRTALEGDETLIDTVYDAVALCISPGYPVANFVILHGDGANGKTTLLDVVREFVGDSVSSESLRDLTGYDADASKAQLYGKRANIIGDMDSGVIKNTGVLKELTDGNTVSAREKYGKKFAFSNEAQIIGAANEPPEFADDSKGMSRRLVPVHMGVDMEAETDEDLMKHEAVAMMTTETELSGILNRAVDAFDRVKERNALALQHEKSAAEIRRGYDTNANPVQAFAELFCDHGEWVGKDQMLNAYNAWADHEGVTELSKGQLTTKLKRVDQFDVEVSRVSHGGGRKRCYRGIELNEDGRRWLGIAQQGAVQQDLE
ncbi:phage/plasmid primase, P4 family [Salinigranum halophilum]|uniref:phage/plasmid primase, P4 family n=1 Tax=Salinigranum halophilum TaxID=2565931 RepID=UPI00115D8001|nr:phage/plasmid primase, P4 family [Salinigranum halophilum]